MYIGPQVSNSPALPGDYSGRGAGNFQQAASNYAGGSAHTLNSQDQRDDVSNISGSAGTPMQVCEKIINVLVPDKFQSNYQHCVHVATFKQNRGAGVKVCEQCSC